MLPQDPSKPSATQLITIRTAAVPDGEAILRLVNVHAARGEILPRTARSVHDTIGDWLVAEVEDEILGCVSLLRYTSGLVEVRSLVVEDSVQGRGIGRRLMEALIEEAKRRQIPRLFALTRAVPFFARFGFGVTDRHQFPEKVWYDCQQCPLLHSCDETAVVLDLEAVDD